MNNNELLNRLECVIVYAEQGPLYRFLQSPFKYSFAIFYSKWVSKHTGRSYTFNTKTFWGERFQIDFPSAIDIFLSGGKTHPSEIRLAKFLIKNLDNDSVFMDIGAHFGYFSLLAAQIIKRGKIFSIEPSLKAFKLLKANTNDNENIYCSHLAMTAFDSRVDFYEFPTLFSEYNTLEKNQYIDEEWYDSKKVFISTVTSSSGDSYIKDHIINPDFIKIDVEGSEDKVIAGFNEFLLQNSPTIIMEFSCSKRGNSNHILADSQLKNLGYKPYSINNNGTLEKITNITSSYVDALAIESDNIIYLR